MQISADRPEQLAKNSLCTVLCNASYTVNNTPAISVTVLCCCGRIGGEIGGETLNPLTFK